MDNEYTVDETKNDGYTVDETKNDGYTVSDEEEGVRVISENDEGIEIYIPEDSWEDIEDDDIIKTSNKDCFSCGCTDYDVKFRKELNEWYCDNCCEEDV